MVDYTELRKKFKAKNPQLDEKRRKKQLAIKKIAREYEAKKAEIAGGAPDLKKGPLFYGMVVLVLVVAGSLVVPAIMRGDLTLGKKRIERNELNARKSMDALSVALGRYKFHVGEYPSAEEGLAPLAYRKPKEIMMVRRQHPGWDGPYINHVVKDPWGNDYFYEPRPEGGNPILYSKGPDVSSRTSSASTSRSATPPGPTTGRRASCAAWWSRPTRPPSSASRSR